MRSASAQSRQLQLDVIRETGIPPGMGLIKAKTIICLVKGAFPQPCLVRGPGDDVEAERIIVVHEISYPKWE